MTDGRLLKLFAMGVVLLDGEGRVRAANDRARGVLYAGEDLQLTDGRLTAVRRDEASELARIFAGTCPLATVGGMHARGAMRMGRASESGARRTLLVADSHARGAASVSDFVLFIHEPGPGAVVSEATLRTLYGLTRAEARIAALLVNRGAVTSIAAEIGVSANTIRTHLKRVFGKLGVRSQLELIRVVLSGPAALQLDGGLGSQVGVKRAGRTFRSPAMLGDL